MPRRRDDALGLLVGVLLDALVADPRTGHPVAAFGTAATALEHRTYGPSRRRGAAYTAICVGAATASGRLAERFAGPARPAVVAAATWAVLGSRSLRGEAATVAELLQRGDVPGARRRITHLVGRDPAALDEAGLARAAVESVAENTCDAVVAPLLWGAVAGVPGLLGYRAANTLDAMVGYRSARYEAFGWAAARLDDGLNLVPARITALLVALAAPAVGGKMSAALHTAVRDGRKHPSPNSGWSEAAYAGALGRRLGGRNEYGGRIEDRPELGAGEPPTTADIGRAARLCAVVTGLAALLAVGVARRPLLRFGRPGRHPGRRSRSEDR